VAPALQTAARFHPIEANRLKLFAPGAFDPGVEDSMKILLAIDGSEGALEAVRHAAGLAQAGLKASFVLANVQEPATLYEVVVAHDAEVIEQVSAAAAAHSLEAAQAMLRAAGLNFETEVASGDPGHLLVEISERFGCDMVIMGARGVGALRAALLGSVSNSVLHAAKVPVTIVKAVED
jgi:nucleotide-binding universal stress UspA family protein